MENDPMQSIAAGEIAMHQDNPHEWLYIGDYLNEEEQEAVVRAIQAELV